MSTTTSPNRPSGRPRDDSIDDAVLSAARELLDTIGYPRLTIAAVALRAGVNKPALYRRWSSKAALVVDVYARHLPPMSFTDTGSLRGDLTGGLTALQQTWTVPRLRQNLLGLMADLAEDPVSSERFHQRVYRPRGVSLLDALERARTRGDLNPHVAPQTVGDLLEGPLMHRVLLAEQPLDEGLLSAIIEGLCAVTLRSR